MARARQGDEQQGEAMPDDGARTEIEKAPAEGGADQVQQQFDEATDQGFHGEKADPRPNADYTVGGVTKDA